LSQSDPNPALIQSTGSLFGPFGYMSDVKRGDPVAEPVMADKAVLSKYLPTLLITGTRAFDMSEAIALHRALVRAGVDASLHVFDGLGHCFYYNAWIPESVDANNTIVGFFGQRLTNHT
jgi:epsilon-lactone hydrolase